MSLSSLKLEIDKKELRNIPQHQEELMIYFMLFGFTNDRYIL